MVKLPAWHFYPGDWKKDPGIQTLTLEERGAWFEILLLMFESEDRGKLLLNGEPFQANDLANVLKTSEANVKQIISKLLAKGVAKLEQNTGVIYSKRMVDDNHLRKVRAKAGKQGGSKTQAKRKQNQALSVSVSSSVTYNNNPLTPFFSKSEATNHFENIWNLYPAPIGKKRALRFFLASVKTTADLEAINHALDEYLKSDRVRKGFIQNGSTWFNDWRSWVNRQEPWDVVRKDIRAREQAARDKSIAQELEKKKEDAEKKQAYQFDMEQMLALPPPDQDRIRAEAEAKVLNLRIQLSPEARLTTKKSYELEIFRKEREEGLYVRKKPDG